MKNFDEILFNALSNQQFPDDFSGFSNEFLSQLINKEKPLPRIFNMNKDDIDNLTKEQLTNIRTFLKENNKPESVKKIISKLKDGKKNTITNPIDNSPAEITGSLLSHTNSLFVFCQSKHSNFYLIQNASFIDGIYYPSKNICLTYGAVYPADFHNFYNQFALNFNHLKEKKTNNKFTGLYISHTRPYHYYYNKITSLVDLLKDNSIGSVNTYSSHGGNFFDLKSIDGVDSFIESDVTSFNTYFLNHNLYPLSVGYKYNYIDSNSHSSVTKCIVKASKSNNYLSALYRSKLSSDDFKLWIGVTSQKRTWIEQVDGLSMIINSLNKKFNGKLTVVFDGWTTPRTGNNSDIREIISDSEVITKILSKLDFTLNYISMIGKQSNEKIIASSMCDFFISGWGSGGIHVSRFSEIKGISHFNNKLSKKGVIDKNGHLVPEELVNDIIEKNSYMSDAHISYSINPKDMIKLVHKKLNH